MSGHHTAIKKIYIDSRFRTDNSSSSSDFKISLPESVNLPDNTKFFIDDVAIPHTWYTIEDGINDRLYIRIFDLDAGTQSDVILDFINENFTGQTLARTIADSLNGVFQQNIFSAFYIENTNKININPNDKYSFQILNKHDISTKMNNTWKGPDYDEQKPRDFNTNVLKMVDNTGPSQVNSSTTPFVSNPIDLQPIKNIYLSSPNLGSYTTIGPRGERTILKKIPVTAGFNFVIFDNTIIKEEFLDISKQTLSTIHIMIHDGAGNLIPLHSAEWSCSLCFSYSG